MPFSFFIHLSGGGALLPTCPPTTESIVLERGSLPPQHGGEARSSHPTLCSRSDGGISPVGLASSPQRAGSRDSLGTSPGCVHVPCGAGTQLAAPPVCGHAYLLVVCRGLSASVLSRLLARRRVVAASRFLPACLLYSPPTPDALGWSVTYIAMAQFMLHSRPLLG